MLFKQCLLHIGTEKTGTTTLQSFLAANRSKLATHGFFVPTSLSPHQAAANHQRLTTYALRTSKTGDDLRRSAGLSSVEDVLSHRIEVREEFVSELNQANRLADTLLLSNEHCHSRLVFTDEVETLRDFIMEFAETVRVVVYLRPQHQLAISLYNQALKAGYHDINILPNFASAERRWVERRYFDYDDLLSRWSSVFGRASVSPYIFDAEHLAAGNIIDDFMRVIDVIDDTLARPKDRNRSLSARLQPALNAVNRYAKSQRVEITPKVRMRVISMLETLSNGRSIQPSRSEVAAFYGQFRYSNETVREEYFPDQRQLFDVDFSQYDEESTAPISETDSLVEALLAVLSDASTTKL